MRLGSILLHTLCIFVTLYVERDFAFKICITGACGPVGRYFTMLTKQHKKIKSIAIHDTLPIRPLVEDLNFISSTPTVYGYDDIGEALSGSDVVIIPSSCPRSPSLSKNSFFQQTCSITGDIAAHCAKHCPNAMFLLLGGPYDFTIPAFAEVMKFHNAYNPKKLIGIMTPDMLKANYYINNFLNRTSISSGSDVYTHTHVPLAGGTIGSSLLPLVSQVPEMKEYIKTLHLNNANTKTMSSTEIDDDDGSKIVAKGRPSKEINDLFKNIQGIGKSRDIDYYEYDDSSKDKGAIAEEKPVDNRHYFESPMHTAYGGYMFLCNLLDRIEDNKSPLGDQARLTVNPLPIPNEADIYVQGFVENTLTPANFSNAKIILGKDGISQILPHGILSEEEEVRLVDIVPDLMIRHNRVEDFMANRLKKV